MKRTFWATVQSAFNRHVKKGLAFLDGKFPNWEDVINLNDLEIKSGFNCICGQIGFRSTYESRYDIGNYNMNSSLGFYLPEFAKGYGEKAWNKLTNTWKREISLRQTAKSTQITSSSELISSYTT